MNLHNFPKRDYLNINDFCLVKMRSKIFCFGFWAYSAKTENKHQTMAVLHH